MRCPKCNTESSDTSCHCADCGIQILPSKESSVNENFETSTKELIRGTTFADRYGIIKELGKGGMGRAYRVEETKLEQEVALKLIKTRDCIQLE